MALRASTGYAFKAVRSVRLQPLLTRAGEALPPKSCAEYGPAASRIGRLFSTGRDPDSLVRDNIKAAVSKGLKEALGHLKNDDNIILKLSIIKSGVNAAVKDSLKDHSVFIDYAEHHVDPVVKLAIEEAVLQGLNKFAD
ncbi:uncharacterized protein LOC125526667 isoform X2 [Triticum urartu]|nr:uncharacterized protein LOC125526667 isoform X2 [Triticum urartu]